MSARAQAVSDSEGRFYGIRVDCPGCAHGMHILPVNWCPDGQASSPHTEGMPHWDFNGDLERPTLKPSILSRSGQAVCHSFVADGRIQFLGDCTHHLKGQTVDLPGINTRPLDDGGDTDA
jgi:hypothetical protein